MSKEQQLNINWASVIPLHNCKLHLVTLEEMHSVNSMHNIVIYRKSKCKICSKVFEVSDPEGIK